MTASFSGAALRAVLYIFPVLVPFLAPQERSITDWANFAGKMWFVVTHQHYSAKAIKPSIRGNYRQRSIQVVVSEQVHLTLLISKKYLGRVNLCSVFSQQSVGCFGKAEPSSYSHSMSVR